MLKSFEKGVFEYECSNLEPYLQTSAVKRRLQ